MGDQAFCPPFDPSSVCPLAPPAVEQVQGEIVTDPCISLSAILGHGLRQKLMQWRGGTEGEIHCGLQV